jgi:hypothetical protein
MGLTLVVHFHIFSYKCIQNTQNKQIIVYMFQEFMDLKSKEKQNLNIVKNSKNIIKK